MARIVTISDNRTDTRGQKKAVKAVAPKINKTFRGTVEDWVRTGDWIKVKSSNVAAIRFLRVNKELYVRFKDGSEYRYSGVSTHTAKDMYGCASMGKFVWSRLRDRFPYSKV